MTGGRSVKDNTKGQQEMRIDTSQIPEHIRMELLSIVYDATVEYFKQPGVEEKYQQWKAEKEKREAETAAKGRGA